MAHTIVKQPNGKYCIFSTVTNELVDQNLSLEQVTKHFCDMAVEQVSAGTLNRIKEANNDLDRYENMLTDICLTHGLKGLEEAERRTS